MDRLPPAAALLLSLVAVAGSLYLSLGLGLKACPLCFYQRTFAFALVAVLAVGLLMPDVAPPTLCVLALPLAVGGLGVAGVHANLVWGGKLECPAGIAGLRSAPEQSLLMFTLILIPLVTGVIQGGGKLGLPAAAAVLLGLLAVYGSVAANPPAMKATTPLGSGEKLETCRVPYPGAG